LVNYFGKMDFLNYHHLRYFWMAAREGGLTRAAKKLRVSQPTICTQIQILENSIGQKLLRRSGQGLALTEAGRQVFGFAEEIFSLGEDLVSTIKRRPTLRRLRVNIGIADSIPKLLSYEMIKPIFKMPQAIQASCCEGKVVDLLSQLAAFRLDIVLSDEPLPASSNIKASNHLLGECGTSFFAVHEIAAKLRRNFPKSLHGAPALLPGPNTALRRALEEWFRDEGIVPELLAEFDDAALMKVVARHGFGFFPLPDPVAQEAVTRYGFSLIGRTANCRQHFYAVSPERRMTHPAVVAIANSANKLAFGGRSRPAAPPKRGSKRRDPISSNVDPQAGNS
jgi:LysR family transcriptional regulator, transcriptional activator of nhaA